MGHIGAKDLLGESETPVTVRGGEISPIENKPPATETSLAAVSPIIAPHKPVNVEEHAVSVQCYDCNSYKEPECLTNPERFKINCTDKRGGSGYKGKCRFCGTAELLMPPHRLAPLIYMYSEETDNEPVVCRRCYFAF